MSTLIPKRTVSVSQLKGKNGTLRLKKTVSVSQPKEINGTIRPKKQVSVSQPKRISPGAPNAPPGNKVMRFRMLQGSLPEVLLSPWC